MLADARVADLEAELRKLRKINSVLMHRVERDVDAPGGDAYSLFRSAITLDARVGERTAELAKLTHQMMQEIAQRRRAETALLAAKAEAEEANIGKTRFLAAASHDLQQPLNAARLFLGALADEVATPRARDLLGRVDAALDSFDDLLGVLLDISRLDAGAWPVSLADLAVAPMLSRLVAEYRPQAEAAGLQLRVVPCGAVIHTDRHLLERVLRNLLSNAIRYTESGRILLGCRRERERLRIEVWDTGIGIAEDRLGQIFEEFHRLGNAPRNESKGLGLGLAIVDRISRLLDLRIAVASRPARGSMFAIGAPYGQLAAMPAVAEADARTPERGGAITGALVVVIENDEASLEGMRVLLDTWGCRLVGATSTARALEALTRLGCVPDLVLADYHLDDGAFGSDAVAALRARFGAVLPALVVSSDRSAELRAKLKAHGLAVLPKPTSPARLRAMLSYLVRQRAAS